VPFTRVDTAVNIINGALSASGLSTVADPYASTDGAVIQMKNLLTSCIRELASMHEWSQFTREMTFTTTSSDNYPLPDDFDYFRNQTGWVSTDALPLGGPLSSQAWQMMVNTSFASSFYIYFRQMQDKFYVWPSPPPIGKDVSIEYQSRNFVLEGASTYKDYADNAADVVLYDPLLIIRFLTLRFKEARGFDTTAAERQFNVIFDSRAGRDAAAPVLSLSGKSEMPLISIDNVPESGYG
jgi:hypothetical protein